LVVAGRNTNLGWGIARSELIETRRMWRDPVLQCIWKVSRRKR
jgi:hypothetical protein